SVAPEVDYQATVDAVQATVDGYPGLVRDVQTYLQQKVREVLSGSSDAIVVRIFGPELEVLREKAEEVRDALASIDGVADARVELQIEEPQVEIEVDLERAEAYGIKPGDVRRAASTLLSGLEAGSLFEQQKVFSVVVWGTPETRHSLTSIRELLIDTPEGDHVRLEDVAEVRIAPTPNTILREAVSRRIDVGLDVGGADLGAVAAAVEARLSEMEFPLEYHAEVLGEHAERQAAQNRMLVYAVAAALGIFLLLQAALQSWRLAALAFFTLPAALVGGLLAAIGTGGVVSLGTLVGLLAVFGIAARNGILLLNHYQHLEQHEGEALGPGLVLRGARERLGPIAMTAGTTALALAPVALFGDAAGHEIAHPVAVTVMGGLVTSTLLNLFIVPALYLRVAPRPKPDMSSQLAVLAMLSLQPGLWLGGSSMRRTDGSLAASARAPILLAEGLRKSYGPRQALRGLTFSLNAGRVLGFLGPNGAGKTTTIRILTTILEPSGGHFAVDSIGSAYPERIRHKIGVLPETLGFPRQITGIEYLVYFGQLYGRSAADARQHGMALLEEVGLERRARSLIGTYSHGMRQRLGIARALVNDPAVVFLDEPTQGLDPRGQQEVLSQVRQIARERSAGVVLCSHLLSEIEGYCDDVIILRDGQVVAAGSVHEVIARARHNVIRIHVAPPSLAEAQRVLEALPQVVKAAPLGDLPGWLAVELRGPLMEGSTEDREFKNAILDALIRAGVPVLSFEAEGGRLQDVFLELTEEVAV
ncbi:MAG TPA: efflux RND transporter permease subunit, partial [Chloroflexota bacterium]|nr:efflux RND transporter permease subunit [Chloroflexota bacterium]